jgi:hypothetical protein
MVPGGLTSGQYTRSHITMNFHTSPGYLYASQILPFPPASIPLLTNQCGRAHPNQPNIHVINPTLLDRLTKEWESVKAVLQGPSKTFSSDPSFSSVWYPKEAYARALAALNRLEKDFGAWRDFVKVF